MKWGLLFPSSTIPFFFYVNIFLPSFSTFRIVYDRETGKPKGYGFCEYRDQETRLHNGYNPDILNSQVN